MSSQRGFLKKKEKCRRRIMEKMQPSKRSSKNVRKWCLKKLQTMTTTVQHTNIQNTMERLYKIDQLMYYRLRLMLDGVQVTRREG